MRISVLESPIMIASDRRPPAAATVRRRISGSGFWMPNVSCPQIRFEAVSQCERFEQQHREAFEFVGADRKAITEAGEFIEDLDEIGEGS